MRATPSDLIQIFNREFNDVLSSCAQTVSVDIELKPGVRVVKALSRDGTIDGGKAQFKFNQIYAATEHYLLLEMEMDKDLAVAGEHDLGIVKVAYTATPSGEAQKLDTPIRARFTQSDAEVSAAKDTKVGEAVVEQVARGRARQAIILRDQGKLEEAAALLRQNATEIDAFTSGLSSPPGALIDLSTSYRAMGSTFARPASPQEYGYQRKTMRGMDARGAGSPTRY